MQSGGINFNLKKFDTCLKSETFYSEVKEPFNLSVVNVGAVSVELFKFLFVTGCSMVQFSRRIFAEILSRLKVLKYKLEY
jgi:hypothetical protein